MDLEKCIPHDLLRFTMIYHDWYVEMDNFFIEMMLVCVLFCRVKLIALRWNLHHFHPRNREISGFSSAWSQKTRGEDQIVPGARQQGSSPMPVGNMAISLGTSENSDTFTFEKEIVEHWDLSDILVEHLRTPMRRWTSNWLYLTKDPIHDRLVTLHLASLCSKHGTILYHFEHNEEPTPIKLHTSQRIKTD